MEDTEEVEQRLEDLARLLPDLVGKLERMRVDILTQLLSDLPVNMMISLKAGWSKSHMLVTCVPLIVCGGSGRLNQ